MSKKIIKLMADYQSWPLWWSGNEGSGNIEPKSLPISAETVERLNRWSNVFDTQLNLDDPSTIQPLQGIRLNRFESEGIALWQKLREELSDAYEVVYFSSLEKKLLSKPESSLLLAA